MVNRQSAVGSYFYGVIPKTLADDLSQEGVTEEATQSRTKDINHLIHLLYFFKRDHSVNNKMRRRDGWVWEDDSVQVKWMTK